MKVVILAGGFGTRISEESMFKPKPMIDIGGKPILWHIMKYYSKFGFNEFVICAGYKQESIKQWFANYFIDNSDVTFDFAKKDRVILEYPHCEPWKVTVVDTGLDTMTGSRIKRVAKYIGDEPFFLTYGDGLSDVDIAAELEFHRTHGKLATMTVVKPQGRFGVLTMEGSNITEFREKSQKDVGFINGGFLICEPQVLSYIPEDDDSIVFEQGPLENLAKDGELMAFRHRGFWQCMDTLRDKTQLEKLLASGKAPWVIKKPQ